jgi:cysteine-rich repeat protein
MYQKLFHSQMRLIASAAVSAMVLALGASAASADTAKCVATISKATAKYELAVQKALGKCQDGKAKGKIPSCPDAATTAAITKSQTSFEGSVSKDCMGETVASVGFSGLVLRCTGSSRDGLFCTREQNCEGQCDAGGQPGEPCTNNNPDPAHGGVASCAGACSLNGVEIVGPPPNFGVVSCKGNGAEQCNLQHACTNSVPTLTQACTTDGDCPMAAAGSCVGQCTSAAVLPHHAGDHCVTDADCGGAALSCSGFGACNVFTGHCGNIGTCDPADRCPAAIDDSAPFANCDAPLATISDVATCLECNSNSIASVATGFAWDNRRPPFGDPAFGVPDDGDMGNSVLGCQRDLGKAVGKYFQAVRKATQKCTASLMKGKVPSCPDPTLTATITNAQTSLSSAISKKCATTPTLFAETLAADNILATDPLAGPLNLPNSTTAFGSSAEALMDTLATCSDGLAVGKGCQTFCGNGQIDIGEDCDDGNVVDGDNCPSDCRLTTACSVTGTKMVTVNLSAPASVLPLGALKVYLAYDDTKVNIPGSGSTAISSVTASAFGQSANDLDSAIIVVLDDPTDVGSPPFSVQFNVCSAASVSASDFNCMVEQAGTAAAVNASGVSCSVTVM